MQDYDHLVSLGRVAGQFVRVETTGNQFLAFAELRAFGTQTVGPTNLAPGGTASGLSEGYGSVFKDAIDGNGNGLFGDGSVWHSLDSDTPAFYEVDLEGDFYIDRIQIAPRSDAQQGSVENFRLTVFADDGAGNPGAVVWSGDYLPANAADFSWGTTDPGGVQGRHVRIERLDAAPRFMTFAEFAVFGSATPLGANVALGKPVTASPAGWGSSPGDGNDGDIDGDFYNPGFPVYHSATSAVGQFWEVDLDGRFRLDYLELFGRTDAATTTQYLVSVLDADRAVLLSETIDPVMTNTIQQYDHLLDLGGLEGRYVRLETTQAQFLAFAELRLFGTAVPEPATFLLALVGAAGLLGSVRRRRRRGAGVHTTGG